MMFCMTTQLLPYETLLVKLYGHIDPFSEMALKEQFNEIVRNENYRLIVNLEGLKFLNCSVLAGLYFLCKEVKKNNGKIVVVCCKADLLQVFNITGSYKCFTIIKTVGEALSYFKSVDSLLTATQNIVNKL